MKTFACCREEETQIITALGEKQKTSGKDFLPTVFLARNGEGA